VLKESTTNAQLDSSSDWSRGTGSTASCGRAGKVPLRSGATPQANPDYESGSLLHRNHFRAPTAGLMLAWNGRTRVIDCGRCEMHGVADARHDSGASLQSFRAI